jgi:hypothetical protein
MTAIFPAGVMVAEGGVGADLAGHRLDRRLRIAGQQHDAADAGAARGGDHGGGIRAQRVAEQQGAGVAAIHRDLHGCGAGRLRRGRGKGGVGGDEIPGPERDAPLPDQAGETGAGRFLDLRRAAQVEPPGPGRLHQGGGEDMAAGLVQRGGKAQQLGFGEACGGLDGDETRRAFRQGAGLVEDQDGEPAPASPAPRRT